jgi:hypothetical protein
MSGLPRFASLLAAASVLTLAGCPHFKLLPAGNEKVENTGKEALARPNHYSVRQGQYVFHSDFELKADTPLFQELGDLREKVYKELEVPSSNSLIDVYLFADETRYKQYLRRNYPGLPERRAFFMTGGPAGAAEERLVFTYKSDRLRQDLRHELTHALLHSALKGVPIWLDEGLAEFFELPAENDGLNVAHVRKQRKDGIHGDLKRLEKLSGVDDMHPAEYREAWAWVYLMMRGTPQAREVLLTYLQQLRTSPNPGPLQPRLASVMTSPEDSLDKLLAALDRENP